MFAFLICQATINNTKKCSYFSIYPRLDLRYHKHLKKKKAPGYFYKHPKIVQFNSIDQILALMNITKPSDSRPTTKRPQILHTHRQTVNQMACFTTDNVCLLLSSNIQYLVILWRQIQPFLLDPWQNNNTLLSTSHATQCALYDSKNVNEEKNNQDSPIAKSQPFLSEHPSADEGGGCLSVSVCFPRLPLMARLDCTACLQRPHHSPPPAPLTYWNPTLSLPCLHTHKRTYGFSRLVQGGSRGLQ